MAESTTLAHTNIITSGVYDQVSYTSKFRNKESHNRILRTKFSGFGLREDGLADSMISKKDCIHKEAVFNKNSSPTQKFAGFPSTASSKSCHSLLKMASEKRARRVTFYRNGDRFFKGAIFAVSSERFRTFDSLLSALTSSLVWDSKTMPNGVRHIYSLDGSRRLESVDELQEGGRYVCASMEAFRQLDYCRNTDHVWNSHIVSHDPQVNCKKREKSCTQRGLEMLSTRSSHCQVRPLNDCAEKQKSNKSKSSKSEMCTHEQEMYMDNQKSCVCPRLITIIRNGKRPRKAVRLLLNKKTAQSFEQVLSNITTAISFECGRVKKVYSLSGQRVMCLADFFHNETVFLACGHEKMEAKDFCLDKQEVHQIRACRPFSGKPQEKIAAKKLLNPSSKSSGSSLQIANDPSQDTLWCEHHDRALPFEREIKTVNKNNIDALAPQLPMPETLASKYQVGKLIGTGNFAVVMECRNKKTNRKYALKIINKELCKGKEEMINNEVRILRCVKHPNIIRLVEDYMNQQQIFYIMELVKGGDLFDAIASSSSKYTEHDAAGMLHNLASALQYLHSLYIVHRDVKPENILIRQHEDGTKSLKLGDFGLATEVRGPLYAVCGTPTYVAPEVIAETGYGLKIDVWSAGVIAYILLCGFPPFSSPTDDQNELFDMIMTGSYDFPKPFWDHISSNAKNVVRGMLETNPDIRLSAAQVLEHKWLTYDSQADLNRTGTVGTSSCFRRGPRVSQSYAGIKIIATTVLDKASKFFQGRGAPQCTVGWKDVLH